MIYSEDPVHNLLLLHVKGIKVDKGLELGNSATFDGNGMLFTSGYDHNGQYQQHQGSHWKEAGALGKSQTLK